MKAVIQTQAVCHSRLGFFTLGNGPGIPNLEAETASYTAMALKVPCAGDTD